jgi:hypothetical protein
MFVQNLWVSKCQNDTNNIYYFYINDMSFLLTCVDVKYVQFTFELNPYNYLYVILDKIM